MKKLLFLAFTILMFQTVEAQETIEQLKAQKSEKAAAIAALQGEMDAISTKIQTFPGWKFGGLGTVGFNLSQFDNWLGSANANARTTTFGLSASGFANLDRAKYFWRNNASFVYTKTKLIPDNNITGEKPGFETTADALNAISLFGYKLTEKFAISALGEYRTTVSNFNNPGYLDLGVGGTWTPIANLVVVIHPLNYNFVFSDDNVAYQSSLGAKIVADYSRSLPMGVAWKSNLSAFLSYEDASNLSSWTWINGFSFTAWKGIGVGFDLGLRSNKQESLGAVRIAEGDTPTTTFDTLKDSDHKLQSYWLLGLTYSF